MRVPVESKLPSTSDFHPDSFCGPVSVTIHHTYQKGILLFLVASSSRSGTIVYLHLRPRVVDQISNRWQVCWILLLLLLGKESTKSLFQMPFHLLLNCITNLSQAKNLLFTSFDSLKNLWPLLNASVVSKESNKVSLNLGSVFSRFICYVATDCVKVVPTVTFQGCTKRTKILSAVVNKVSNE